MSAKYDAYLQTDCWKEIRNEVMARAKGRCQLRLLCTGAVATQTHHPNYNSVGQERPEDLIACCRRCHRHVHGLDTLKPANDNQRAPANDNNAARQLNLFAGVEEEVA